ncbi:MAG: type II secretion system F family protein [Candidatus Aenigmarchaeota archaeon]|nr:type II secretion system F family protein [Candidatus Aenigmarchaeota archaeon]
MWRRKAVQAGAAGPAPAGKRPPAERRTSLFHAMPFSYQHKLKELLRLAGSKRSPEGFLRGALVWSLLLGGVAGFLSGTPLVFPLAAAVVFVLAHGMLVLAVDRRTKFVENILPDALQLMAANARAGYIPSRALMLSARKEFGPLAEAIKYAGKEMLTGQSVEEALRLIPRLFRSDILEKTINLIIEGSRSGGHFATLLEENAEQIRRSQVVQKEVKANVMMYIIFIGFAGVVAAPVLYALSGFLITTIGTVGSAAAVPEQAFAKIPFVQFGGLEISPAFIYWFSVGAIAITTFFGGILIGAISAGSERAGIKYVPIFMTVAFVIFFVANSFIGNLFGGLIPGG